MPSPYSPFDTFEREEAFRRALSRWYLRGHRSLPWRATTNAYHIWLSEVILQQTRVDQGTAYYHRFLEAFPRVQDLASADEDRVLKLWQGLGYYSRARNLRAAAIQIVEQFGGELPQDRKALLSLPGIGPYTAAAILSFAYNLPFATVDGNVQRVISRLAAIAEPVDTPKGRKKIDLVAESLLDKRQARIFNNATMELGATVCLPSSPLCSDCPVSSFCLALRLDLTQELPKKSPKGKLRNRYFHYIDIRDPKEAKMLLGRRGNGDIWQGLYQPLLIETAFPAETDEFLQHGIWEELSQLFGKIQLMGFTNTSVHILSHQRIHARLYRVRAHLGNRLDSPIKDYRLIAVEDLPNYAVSKLVDSLFSEKNVLF